MPLDRTSDHTLRVGTANTLLIALHDDQTPPTAVTDATILVTVYDEYGVAVTNAAALPCPYVSGRSRYRCVIPGNAMLVAGGRYAVQATAALIDWKETYHLTAVE